MTERPIDRVYINLRNAISAPDALRAIASMMGTEGYRPDACDLEVLILEGAAGEIERLRKALHSIAKEYDGKAVAEAARAALEGK